MRPNEPYSGPKPWSKRSRLKSNQTWTGRVVYTRKPHFFTPRDAARIMAKITPETVAETETKWYNDIFVTIREATIKMLEEMIFFLPEDMVRQGYTFVEQLLMKLLQLQPNYYTEFQSVELQNISALINETIERQGH